MRVSRYFLMVVDEEVTGHWLDWPALLLGSRGSERQAGVATLATMPEAEEQSFLVAEVAELITTEPVALVRQQLQGDCYGRRCSSD